MTLGEMYTELASLLDDVNFGYFTKPQLLRFLNNSQRELQKLLLQSGNSWYNFEKTKPTVTNQAEYSLPYNFLKLNRLELVQNPGLNETWQKIEAITLNQKDYFPKAGMPQAYYLSRTNLVLCPAPNNAVYTLRLNYSYRVADMIADESVVPDVPEEYHELLVLFAVVDCLIKDGRDASLLEKKRDEWVLRMRRDADERLQDGPRMVRMTDGDSLGGPW